MRLGQIILLSTLILGSTCPAVALTHSRRGPTSPRIGKRTSKTKPQSQRTIDDERATQIQSALIRSGYLSGEPSGHWDAETQAAMEKLQGDNGWQTKLVPDSRAIIKLGLGSSTASGNSLADQATLSTSSQPNAFSR
jgi:peptidoglycan hydrolase-like protein with peptidoglycan-binding domain